MRIEFLLPLMMFLALPLIGVHTCDSVRIFKLNEDFARRPRRALRAGPGANAFALAIAVAVSNNARQIISMQRPLEES